MNQSRHIDKLVEKQCSMACVRSLMFQACAFRGNFIELIKLLASYNDQVNGAVMENVPQNAKYTSPKIQKEILHIFANKMFVDKDGFIRERFFHIVHVKNTMALTLKNEICVLLSRYDLQIENIRALFLKDCPYAYYVHCWAHKLQLALVATSIEVKHVHQFFVHLTSIINIIVGSSKCHDELQTAQAAEIESLITSYEIEIGKGANQIGTLQRPRDTRWGSHFQFGSNYSQRGDAEAAYMVLISFEFILILYMIKKIMGIINALCQSLQQNSQYIVNAMSLVSTTKVLIQNLRDDGWESLLTDVKSFCEKHQIDIPDMNEQYTRARGKSCRQVDKFNDHTMELLILSVALNPKDMSTLSELCRGLAILEKSKIYYLIDRLIRLVFTLLVSTAITEQAFSTMKFIKTRLRTRMEDEFLADHLLVYIEKEIAKNFTSKMIMDKNFIS
ncbi:hypothetical protein CIPAW_15G082100 [Carya illinoinensis]|uniref:HAT C-terminal dimerisation domain-containing protein n=1 Tax=Carya illinoinensis TaxID=32201 RepID=A0A8T1N982_CARIL|nr:hypothetical protein CIPAW_15G082100 [Carya illinoinensis]